MSQGGRLYTPLRRTGSARTGRLRATRAALAGDLRPARAPVRLPPINPANGAEPQWVCDCQAHLGIAEQSQKDFEAGETFFSKILRKL
jgi:hypothetical protein